MLWCKLTIVSFKIGSSLLSGAFVAFVLRPLVAGVGLYFPAGFTSPVTVMVRISHLVILDLFISLCLMCRSCYAGFSTGKWLWYWVKWKRCNEIKNMIIHCSIGFISKGNVHRLWHGSQEQPSFVFNTGTEIYESKQYRKLLFFIHCFWFWSKSAGYWLG